MSIYFSVSSTRNYQQILCKQLIQESIGICSVAKMWFNFLFGSCSKMEEGRTICCHKNLLCKSAQYHMQEENKKGKSVVLSGLYSLPSTN